MYLIMPSPLVIWIRCIGFGVTVWITIFAGFVDGALRKSRSPGLTDQRFVASNGLGDLHSKQPEYLKNYDNLLQQISGDFGVKSAVVVGATEEPEYRGSGTLILPLYIPKGAVPIRLARIVRSGNINDAPSSTKMELLDLDVSPSADSLLLRRVGSPGGPRVVGSPRIRNPLPARPLWRTHTVSGPTVRFSHVRRSDLGPIRPQRMLNDQSASPASYIVGWGQRLSSLKSTIRDHEIDEEKTRSKKNELSKTSQFVENANNNSNINITDTTSSPVISSTTQITSPIVKSNSTSIPTVTVKSSTESSEASTTKTTATRKIATSTSTRKISTSTATTPTTSPVSTKKSSPKTTQPISSTTKLASIPSTTIFTERPRIKIKRPILISTRKRILNNTQTIGKTKVSQSLPNINASSSTRIHSILSNKSIAILTKESERKSILSLKPVDEILKQISTTSTTTPTTTSTTTPTTTSKIDITTKPKTTTELSTTMAATTKTTTPITTSTTTTTTEQTTASTSSTTTTSPLPTKTTTTTTTTTTSTTTEAPPVVQPVRDKHNKDLMKLRGRAPWLPKLTTTTTTTATTAATTTTSTSTTPTTTKSIQNRVTLSDIQRHNIKLKRPIHSSINLKIRNITFNQFGEKKNNEVNKNTKTIIPLGLKDLLNAKSRNLNTSKNTERKLTEIAERKHIDKHIDRNLSLVKLSFGTLPNEHTTPATSTIKIEKLQRGFTPSGLKPFILKRPRPTNGHLFPNFREYFVSTSKPSSINRRRRPFRLRSTPSPRLRISTTTIRPELNTKSLIPLRWSQITRTTGSPTSNKSLKFINIFGTSKNNSALTTKIPIIFPSTEKQNYFTTVKSLIITPQPHRHTVSTTTIKYVGNNNQERIIKIIKDFTRNKTNNNNETSVILPDFERRRFNNENLYQVMQQKLPKYNGTLNIPVPSLPKQRDSQPNRNLNRKNSVILPVASNPKHNVNENITDKENNNNNVSKQIQTSVKTSFSFHVSKGNDEDDKTENVNEVPITSFTKDFPLTTSKYQHLNEELDAVARDSHNQLHTNLATSAETAGVFTGNNSNNAIIYNKTPLSNTDRNNPSTVTTSMSVHPENKNMFTLGGVISASSTIPSRVTTRTRSTTIPITTHRPSIRGFTIRNNDHKIKEITEKSTDNINLEISSIPDVNNEDITTDNEEIIDDPYSPTFVNPTSHMRPIIASSESTITSRPPNTNMNSKEDHPGWPVLEVISIRQFDEQGKVDSSPSSSIRETEIENFSDLSFASRPRPTSSEKEQEAETETSTSSSASQFLYIIAIVGIIPAFVVVGLIVRRQLGKTKKSLPENEERAEGFTPITHHQSRKPMHTPILPRAEVPSSVEATNPRCSPWEFPLNKLKLVSVLGEGNFGIVYKAEARELCGCSEDGSSGPTVLVAVKRVKDGAGPKEKQDLLQELAVMQHLGQHTNVVTLLGCCTQQDPTLLIMEYVMFGKLLTFLRDHRSKHNYYNFSSDTEHLTSHDLTRFAWQIASGCAYLQSRGIIHRDLASRNIVVDHNKVCKIADFGLARNVKDLGSDIYEQKSRGALPIRWMAPESLYMNIFTHKSDVWSYGILCWEIVTLGSTPYPGLSAREVMRRVREGYRLDRPEHCKPELYHIVTKCWHQDLNRRPTFSDLKVELAELLDHQLGYIDLENFPESSYYSMLQNNEEKL